MKTIFHLLMIVATILFCVVAVIKIVMGCSWKEAVGIAEELCKEIQEACPSNCCKDTAA